MIAAINDPDVFWIHFVEPDRTAFLEATKEIGFYPKILSALDQPGKSKIGYQFRNQSILDLRISEELDEYQESFLILIGLPSVLISLGPVKLGLVDSVEEDLDSYDNIDSPSREILVGLIFDHLLDLDARMLRDLTKVIDIANSEIMGKPFTGTVSELEEYKKQLVFLQEIFEDQFSSSAIIPSNARLLITKNTHRKDSMHLFVG